MLEYLCFAVVVNFVEILSGERALPVDILDADAEGVLMIVKLGADVFRNDLGNFNKSSQFLDIFKDIGNSQDFRSHAGAPLYSVLNLFVSNKCGPGVLECLFAVAADGLADSLQACQWEIHFGVFSS